MVFKISCSKINSSFNPIFQKIIIKNKQTKKPKDHHEALPVSPGNDLVSLPAFQVGGTDTNEAEMNRASPSCQVLLAPEFSHPTPPTHSGAFWARLWALRHQGQVGKTEGAYGVSREEEG